MPYQEIKDSKWLAERLGDLGLVHSVVIGKEPENDKTKVYIIESRAGSHPYPCCVIDGQQGGHHTAYRNKLHLVDPKQLILWVRDKQSLMVLCNPESQATTNHLDGASKNEFQQALDDPRTSFFLLGVNEEDDRLQLVLTELPTART